MRCWIAIFACAMVTAAALPFGSMAKADGYYSPVRAVAVAPTFTRKLCTPPSSRWDRTPATWICSASQKCCYDRVFRRGTCVGATDRCL